jgi:hypothetical protein
MDRPIIVSAPLIKPIQDGRKTLTSRLTGLEHVNKDPDNYALKALGDLLAEPRLCATFQNLSDDEERDILCPYGGLGSMLWVREGWYVSRGYDGRKPREMDKSGHILVGYIADGNKPGWGGRGRAAIHMPREFSRLKLVLTGLSCDRVQDISEVDAEREGVPRGSYGEGPGVFPHLISSSDGQLGTYFDGFKYTWINLNGRESWDRNPWVWRLYFKLLTPST